MQRPPPCQPRRQLPIPRHHPWIAFCQHGATGWRAQCRARSPQAETTPPWVYNRDHAASSQPLNTVVKIVVPWTMYEFATHTRAPLTAKCLPGDRGRHAQKRAAPKRNIARAAFKVILGTGVSHVQPYKKTGLAMRSRAQVIASCQILVLGRRARIPAWRQRRRQRQPAACRHRLQTKNSAA